MADNEIDSAPPANGSATIGQQRAVLSEQATALAEQSARERATSATVRQLRAEVSELRAALLAAEGDLIELRQLEADALELRQLFDRLRTIVDDRDLWLKRYELVVNSNSWRLTAPLRTLMVLLRQKRA